MIYEFSNGLAINLTEIEIVKPAFSGLGYVIRFRSGETETCYENIESCRKCWEAATRRSVKSTEELKSQPILPKAELIQLWKEALDQVPERPRRPGIY